jgi:hypothetical protein
LLIVDDALDSLTKAFSCPALRNAIAQALDGVANNPEALKTALDVGGGAMGIDASAGFSDRLGAALDFAVTHDMLRDLCRG